MAGKLVRDNFEDVKVDDNGDVDGSWELLAQQLPNKLGEGDLDVLERSEDWGYGGWPP